MRPNESRPLLLHLPFASLMNRVLFCFLRDRLSHGALGQDRPAVSGQQADALVRPPKPQPPRLELSL